MSKEGKRGQGCGIVLIAIAAFFVLAAIVGSDPEESVAPVPQAAAPATLTATPQPARTATAATDPEATAVVSPTPSGPETIHETYIVQPGDTLNRIAARFSQEAGHNVTVAAIVAANGIPNPARIGVGQRFTIPVVVTDGTPASTTAATPVPTAPSSSLSENAYISGITTHIGNASKALTTLGGLLQNPQIGNDVWTVTVAIQMSTLRIANEGIAKMQPPPRFSAAHEDLVLAFGLFDEATRSLARGIDRHDSQLIDLASDQMLEGGMWLSQASAKLKRLLP